MRARKRLLIALAGIVLPVVGGYWFATGGLPGRRSAAWLTASPIAHRGQWAEGTGQPENSLADLTVAELQALRLAGGDQTIPALQQWRGRPGAHTGSAAHSTPHSTDFSDSTMSMLRSRRRIARFTIIANAAVNAAEYT